MIYYNILENLSGSPLVKLSLEDLPFVSLFAKAEYLNATGSVKDRAANYVLNNMLNNGEIAKNTTIIESSSGNFGIALSAYCRLLGLKFKCVIDPNINPINAMLIKYLGADLITVNTRDVTGGYLLTRLEMVKRIQAKENNCFWVNQYANPNVAKAYYETLGMEICREVSPIDYIFIGVSSGGTLSGVSRCVKDHYPNACVIAVDVVGSVIFGHPPAPRRIPGIGASIRPVHLDTARIDESILVEEYDSAMACHELLRKHAIFAGGSSGSVYFAIKHYFKSRKYERSQNVVMLIADRGDRYADTIYNEKWCKELKNNK